MLSKANTRSKSKLAYSPERIYIPTINDDLESFANLFRIVKSKSISVEGAHVFFDFTKCLRLRPNAIAFLGGLARLIQSHQGSVVFAWSTLKKDILKNIIENGFAGNFELPIPQKEGNSIPYREDKDRNPDAIMDYLEHYWIGKGWVNISKKLMNAIIGTVWEIYNNAFEHSGSQIGVFSCGQYFPDENELVLSVVDFGIGIPQKVRNFLKADPRADKLLASACLKWAFQPGTTTKINEPGGNGLDLLKEFVMLNKGKLEVYSNEGYAIIGRLDKVGLVGERYENCEIPFGGTIVHITLCRDEMYYHFRDERM